MKQSSKRLLSMVLAIVMVFAAFFVYFTQIQPAYSDIQGVRSQIYSGNDFLNNETAVVARLQDTLKKYENDPSVEQAVSAAIPAKEDDAAAAHELTALAVSSGLGIQSVAALTASVESVKVSQSAANSDNKFVLRPLGVSNFQLKLAGSYSNFRSFLEKVERNIRIMDMKNVTVEELGKPNQDQYLFTATVATYFQSQ
jgi:Tfp pilus assembly protein PilO